MHVPQAPRSFQSCAAILFLLLSDSASLPCTCLMHHAPSRAVLRPFFCCSQTPHLYHAHASCTTLLQSCAATLLLQLSDSASLSCTCRMHHAPSRAVLRPFFCCSQTPHLNHAHASCTTLLPELCCDPPLCCSQAAACLCASIGSPSLYTL
jgi:hypothetical protein